MSKVDRIPLSLGQYSILIDAGFPVSNLLPNLLTHSLLKTTWRHY